MRFGPSRRERCLTSAATLTLAAVPVKWHWHWCWRVAEYVSEFNRNLKTSNTLCQSWAAMRCIWSSDMCKGVNFENIYFHKVTVRAFITKGHRLIHVLESGQSDYAQLHLYSVPQWIHLTNCLFSIPKNVNVQTSIRKSTDLQCCNTSAVWAVEEFFFFSFLKKKKIHCTTQTIVCLIWLWWDMNDLWWSPHPT